MLGLVTLLTAFHPTTDLWGPDSFPALAVANNSPVIVDFKAVHGTGHVWTFSGTVQDENPGGLTVVFGGLASLQGMSVATNADGSFTITVLLQPGESGGASAQTTDAEGLKSNVAAALVTP